jgi:membrane protein
MEGSASGHRLAKLRHMAGQIWTDARRLRPRRTVEALVRGYGENDILTYASAISFRVIFALIPLGLFALGVLGFLHLDEVWRQDVAPDIRPNVSPAAFTVMEGTVNEVLGQRQLFWITFGAAIAIWEISGAMRAIMRVFNAIYGVEDRRSFWRRVLVSCTLAVVVGVLILVAVVVARFGGAAVQAALGGSPIVAVIAFALRWGVTIALLLFVVGILGRFAPATRRPVRWGSFGALLVVVGWVAMSLIFAWYVSSIADYGSIYGGLATVFVTMEYLYLSTIVFLTGIQIDALTRRSVEGPGEPSGELLSPGGKPPAAH